MVHPTRRKGRAALAGILALLLLQTGGRAMLLLGSTTGTAAAAAAAAAARRGSCLLRPAVGARARSRAFASSPLVVHAAAGSNGGGVSPALDAVKEVKSGRTTAEALVSSSLAKIAEVDGEVGAFLSVMGEEAMAAARLIDRRVASGEKEVHSLPLAGLPVAVKDNICMKGVQTTAGSKILAGYRPTYDATAVERLRAAGAIIIGKTNMDEFGMGSSTENSAYQVTRNPRALDRSPGGSSGGSAAAVASGSVLVALGTDTGGSIRQPASWCGIVGLKPTYGRVSRRGLIAYASSTDCIGPLATTVSDCAAITSVLIGSDRAGDATSTWDASENYVEALQSLTSSGSKPLAGLRVGVIKEAFDASSSSLSPDVSSSVQASIKVLSELGADVVDVSLPLLPQQCAAYYVNVLSEASANLARFDGVRYGYRNSAETTSAVMTGGRHEGFGAEVRRRILLGTFSLSAGYSDAFYKKAQAIRRQLRDDFKSAGEIADVFVCPTAPTTAYALGEYAAKGVASYADDIFTVPASLAGLPAISIPCGTDGSGLPIGLQIIGPPSSELEVLKIARAYEHQSS